LDTFSKICTEICGDGIRFSPSPWCDDGNVLDGDGCSATCQVENGFACHNGSSQSADKCFRIYPPSAVLSFPNQTATYAMIIFSQEIVNFTSVDISAIEVTITGDAGGFNYSLSLNQNKIDMNFEFTQSFKKNPCCKSTFKIWHQFVQNTT